MVKKILSTLFVLILILSVSAPLVYAEEATTDNTSTQESSGTTNEESSEDISDSAILEVLTCTEGYTSIPVGKHKYPSEMIEVIQLIPNLGYHIYGVEINGVFQELSSDTVNVPISYGKIVTVKPVFRGNLVFNVEQSAGGKLTPEGTVYVGTGKVFEVTATPETGYICTGIYINDVGLDIKKENNTYKGSFKAPKEKDYTVYATFEPVSTHTVTLTQNEGGKVLPFNSEGKAFVLSGENAQFQIIPDEGFGIKSVVANGKSMEWSADGTFIVNDVSSDFEVNVEFVPMESIPVSIKNLGNGSLTPADKAYFNTTLVLDVLPKQGYELVSVKVNGEIKTLNKNGKLEIFIDEKIQALEKLEIEALFDVIAERFVIRTIVQNSIGGSITALGYTIENMRTEVRKGDNITLTFTPDMNYIIQLVKVDGVEVRLSEGNTYTLNNVTESHNVTVYFTPDMSGGDNYFKISVFAGEGGTITPSGQQLVKPGQSVSFTFTPHNGYTVDRLVVDGETIIYNENVYHFNNVIIDHSIEVYFRNESSSSNGEIDWTKPEVIIDIRNNTVVKAELFKEISSKAKGRKVIFQCNGYKWTFEADSQYPENDFDFGLLIGKNFVESTIIDALENKMVENKIQGFDYEIIKTNGEKLPSNATITLTLPAIFNEKELDYLLFDEKTGKFDSVFHVIKEEQEDYKLDSNKLFVSEKGEVSFPYNGDKYLVLVVSSTSKFKLNVIVDGHGAASPRGESSILINTKQSIQISPDPGYMVSDIIVNGTSMFKEYVGKTSAFSILLGKITCNYTIEIKFSPAENTITSQEPDSFNETENALKPWAVALIIIGIAIVGGIILFIYKWNAEKDIVD